MPSPAIKAQILWRLSAQWVPIVSILHNEHTNAIGTVACLVELLSTHWSPVKTQQPIVTCGQNGTNRVLEQDADL